MLSEAEAEAGCVSGLYDETATVSAPLLLSRDIILFRKLLWSHLISAVVRPFYYYVAQIVWLSLGAP